LLVAPGVYPSTILSRQPALLIKKNTNFSLTTLVAGEVENSRMPAWCSHGREGSQ
jgi:hypothetical protein